MPCDVSRPFKRGTSPIDMRGKRPIALDWFLRSYIRYALV